ncbi:DUF378 domain-containing protein [Candidatus Daviesbacteria bacterium]|nr:DUF378 domain-containing protein [Candidatus Daviesbacteria bacterium]
MKALHMAAYTLLWVGGVNLGLSALGFDVVNLVLGGLGLVQIFNILVGLSAVYSAATHMGDCKVCGKG